MKNYIQPSENITIPAPAAVKSGDGVMVGSLFGVANVSAEAGDNVALSTVGVFELPKITADDLPLGAAVYWNSGASKVTVDDSGNAKIGVAVNVAATGASSARVRLNGAF